MVSKDKKRIYVSLPIEFITMMDKSIEADNSGITKSEIITTALAMLFGLANARAKEKAKEHKEDC